MKLLNKNNNNVTLNMDHNAINIYNNNKSSIFLPY